MVPLAESDEVAATRAECRKAQRAAVYERLDAVIADDGKRYMAAGHES